MAIPKKFAFRPRARLLQMLGDQLIGSNRLAVFELVKNAYDADASEVDLTFSKLGTAEENLLVKDNGVGMTLETIANVWLEPGSDFREKQRRQNIRSEKYRRLPLGEKGVGRFAVHKLGRVIEVRTRHAGHPEYTVSIDWESYAQHRYMDEASIKIEESSTPVFKGKGTGTQIKITSLRSPWKRGDVRRLWRNVQSISSPLKTPDKFQVNLLVPEHEDWLEKLVDASDFIKSAMWHFTFFYDRGRYEWNYEFKPLPGIKIKGHKNKSGNGAQLKLAPQHQKQFATLNEETGRMEGRMVADPELTTFGGKEQLGPIMGEFYAFDRDKAVLDIMPEAKTLTDFLDENGGVRVYRDGVRVYNYGERAAGDDWLGLDQRRVNIPTRRLSNNIIVGVIDLSLAESGDPDIGLVEKTNREGFFENEAFEKFKAIVLAALIELESLREPDKENIKLLFKGPVAKSIADIESPLAALREELRKRKLDQTLAKNLQAVENKFNEMKEIMTHAGNAGLNLGVLFHEIDRGVKGLTAAIKKKAPPEQLLERSEHLSQLLDGFSTLLRKDKRKVHRVFTVLQECKLLNEMRFEMHDIVFSCPVLSGEQKSFDIKVSLGMVLGALSNLIDNSIYWLQVRWPKDRKRRAIYIGTTDYFDEGPAIVIADNGPGLPTNSADLTKPFVTTKPDGMGLGLYYVNLVCELNNARLVISPDRTDVGIPRAYDGAAFAIVFNKD